MKKRTKTLHTLYLHDANHTIITTRKPKSFHKDLIDKFNSHIANPINYLASRASTNLMDEFDMLANGIIIS